MLWNKSNTICDSAKSCNRKNNPKNQCLFRIKFACIECNYQMHSIGTVSIASAIAIKVGAVRSYLIFSTYAATITWSNSANMADFCIDVMWAFDRRVTSLWYDRSYQHYTKTKKDEWRRQSRNIRLLFSTRKWQLIRYTTIVIFFSMNKLKLEKQRKFYDVQVVEIKKSRLIDKNWSNKISIDSTKARIIINKFWQV